MQKKYKKILVINTFGIGDVLFATPMIRVLKQNMPHADIDFMCNERCRYILKNNRYIKDIMIFEKDHFRETARKSKMAFLKKFCRFLVKIRRKQYDLAIDLSLGYQISLILKLLGIKKRIGFNYRNRGKFLTDKLTIDGFTGRHVVEFYLDILKLLNIESAGDKKLELTLSPGLNAWADDYLQRNNLGDKTLVAIAPGGGKSWGEYAIYRRWDPGNFSYVARELNKKQKNLFFIILGSEDEKFLCRAISKDTPPNCIDVCGKLPLPHSIALIKRSGLLLCNDGGLLHIAISQGTSTLSIFGPVDDKVYGPYPPSERHRVVKAVGLSCRPCYRNFKHRMCRTHDCLKNIDRNEVLSLAEASLGL